MIKEAHVAIVVISALVSGCSEGVAMHYVIVVEKFIAHLIGSLFQ